MKIRIIDANSIGYAQHHSQAMRQIDGLEVQAAYGVVGHVRRHIQYDPESLNILVWDGHAQWRFDIHPGYKASRTQALVQQISRAAYEAQKPIIMRMLSAMPVIQLKHPHAEADDLAYGLAIQLSNAGHDVTVFTADTDWLQMVRKNLHWSNARKYGNIVSDANFEAATPYSTPYQVVEVKALGGDISDDIPGINGIALKRALYLLNKYGSLEEVLSLAEFDAFQKESIYFHALHDPANVELVRRNIRLVDLALGPALEGFQVERIDGEYDPLSLGEQFSDFQFSEYIHEWKYWDNALSVDLPKGSTAAVSSALNSLKNSWK